MFASLKKAPIQKYSLREMRAIATNLATVKSKQDIEGAMQIYHPNAVLEAPSLNSVATGKLELEGQLGLFFALFPDYEAIIEDSAASGDTMVGWGRIRMTLTGEFDGAKPNGKRADLPVFMLFKFEDGRVLYESFNFDFADLCRQSGISPEKIIPA